MGQSTPGGPGRQEPATVDPLFLDEMIAKPQQTYPVKLGSKTFDLSSGRRHL